MLRRERKYLLAFGVFLLSVFGMVYWIQAYIPFYLCWLTASVSSFIAYQLRQVQCPHCRKTIHQYWQHFPYCPYCQGSLTEKREKD